MDTKPPSASAGSPRDESLHGDLCSLVAHDLNNLLNTMLLQLTILERKGLPEELLSETAVIRQTGRQAAALLKHLQDHVRPETSPLLPLDLNELVREVFAGRNGVRLELAAHLPRVQGRPEELRQALQMLVADIAASAPDSSLILARSEVAEDRVLLHISDEGPSVSPEDLPRHFGPFFRPRPGSDGVRLPVCRAMVRRLHGSVRAENRAEGGMWHVVELRRAVES